MTRSTSRDQTRDHRTIEDGVIPGREGFFRSVSILVLLLQPGGAIAGGRGQSGTAAAHQGQDDDQIQYRRQRFHRFQTRKKF